MPYKNTQNIENERIVTLQKFLVLNMDFVEEAGLAVLQCVRETALQVTFQLSGCWLFWT